ncbi:DUF4221 family protein [Algoriphagus aquimarinus]|uniref:DUF4221 domain-containing protein n=1 Tax=Algoriphagus aquimarinus TaxID=237018 RepID=A0A1I1CJA2_9BACT|nr:DUF4221 family protein [Algoriphagus aquimarinus]SFB60730.1 protein of unknown function [Algoriphagus aquimarinus]
MTRFLTFLFLIVMMSCSAKEEKEEVMVPKSKIEFSYTIDTVRIDAGETKPYLGMNLTMADYSAQEGLLYNLEPETGRVEVIDVEKQKLLRLIQYDMRGRNSIKEYYPSGIKKTVLGETFFRDFYVIHRMDSARKKIETYKLDNNSLKGDRLPYETTIDGSGEIASDGTYYAGFYGNFNPKGQILGIAKVRFSDKSMKLIPIDFWDQLKEYTITVNHSIGRRSSSTEMKFLTLNGPDFILSTSASNELWYYMSEIDSVVHRSYHSMITSDKKSGEYKKEVTTHATFEYWAQRKNQEITFGPLVKDPDSQRFYRYSRELDQSNPESARYVYVLTVFNEKLEQIHEEKLRNRISILGKYFAGKTFVHKGMIYSYINLNDEMAFLRLKPDFSE